MSMADAPRLARKKLGLAGWEAGGGGPGSPVCDPAQALAGATISGRMTATCSGSRAAFRRSNMASSS